MSLITVTDVVPALEALEPAHLDRELATHASELALVAMPAHWLIADHVVGESVRPTLALPVARTIAFDARLAALHLGSVTPDIVRGGLLSRSPDPPLGELAALGTLGITRWAELANWAPERLCQALGELEAVVIVAHAVRQATTQALGLAIPAPRPPSGLLESLGTLALWAEGELHFTTLGDAVVAIQTGVQAPHEVRRAAERLGALPLSTLAVGDRSPYDLTGALRRLLSCDQRAQSILEGRIFAGAKKLTLDELGSQLGVTRERIRQIESQLKSKMDALLEGGGVDVISRAAKRLREELGPCSRLDDLPDAAAWAIGLRDAPSHEDAIHARVLLQAAGPFTVYDEWLIREPVAEVIGAGVRELNERLADALVPLEDARDILGGVGVPSADHETWLERVCRCRVIDETVLPWRGSMADKTVALLKLRGEPLTGEEIAEALGPGANYRSMINQVQADSRFLRRGLKLYGLSAWGGEEYTTVAEEIEQEIDRQGGAASLDHLISTLCDQFGVSESSVRAYAAAPPFVRTPDGRITVGSGDVKYSRRAIEDCRGCFRVGPHWSLRVIVDSEILRGSGRPVPIGVPQLLGMQPGESRHARTPVGELLVRYSRQATIGSLRRAALDAGCDEGDRLFVIFTGDASIEFMAVPASRLEELEGPMRLAGELGAEGGSDPIAAIAYALGLPSDEYRVGAIRRRLVARKEGDLLQFVAAVGDDDPDHEVLSQLIGLGE